MSSDATRALIGQLTYSVDLARPATDDDVSTVARGVLGLRLYSATPAEYYAAIEEALRDPTPVAWPHQDERHLRAFLTALGQQLDAARPWPEPPFRTLPVDGRADLASAPVLGRIPRSERQVTTALNAMFERRGLPRATLVLALTDGREIALTAPLTPSTDPVEIRSDDTDDSGLRGLVGRATGLPVEAVS